MSINFSTTSNGGIKFNTPSNGGINFSTPASGGGGVDWTPAQLTTEGWYDADDAGTITEVTGVSQWDDKSGNARHVAQGIGARQPIYSATGSANGKGQIAFDGSDDNLFKVDATMTATVFTRFMVYRLTTLKASSQLINSEGLINNNTEFESGAGVSQFAGSVVNTLSKTVDTDYIRVSEYDGASSMVYRDGDLTGTGPADAGATGYTGITIGSKNGAGTPSAWSAVTYNEVIIINSVLSTSDRQKLEGYAAWKWGLEGSLPAGHPYKSAAPTV